MEDKDIIYRFPQDNKYAQYELFLSLMEEGCASVEDFKQQVKIKRQRDVPIETIRTILCEMERLGMAERRYCDSMMRDDYHYHLYFPIKYINGVKVTEPYFHKQHKMSATERMYMYHGMHRHEAGRV